MSKWKDIGFKILSFLWPKFYNRITWAVVTVGLSFIGTSLIERVVIALLDVKFDITLPNDLNNWIGFSLVLIGLIYNIFMKLIDNKFELGLALKPDPSFKSDINVYNRIIDLLPFSSVEQLGTFDFGGSFQWSRFQHTDSYMENMNSPEFVFFNSELESLRHTLNNNLGAFNHAVSKNAFNVKGKHESFAFISK